MALRKVAPTTQNPTRQRGKGPDTLNIVLSAEGTYVIDDEASADAVVVASGDGTYVINDDPSTAGRKKLRRVGNVSSVILS